MVSVISSHACSNFWGFDCNPVLLSACARAEILSGDSQWGCKEWRQHHAERTHRHACNNLHFITDLDRPQDIEDFERKYSQRLSWPSPS